MSRVVIRSSAQGDPARLHVAFTAVGWDKSLALFERYLDEHAAQTRLAVLAEVDGEVAGYVTLTWQSKYPPFAKQGIPEVSDLNVLPDHRRCGIATELLNHVERIAGRCSPTIGLGVGLYADYGAAQRIYVRRGYLPDGRGVMYANQPVPAGKTVPLDDDATLMFTKQVDLDL
jgi:GNAT superfamily N-acetyltransferase